MNSELKLNPFHEGERQIQQSVGVEERMLKFGQKVIRDFMPDQHRRFYESLNYLFLGHADLQGDVWASVLSGKKDFIISSTDKSLEFKQRVAAYDPFSTSLKEGLAVGLLGINLANRRRNRLSAVVNEVSEEGFSIEVKQSFGNCPKYIHKREVNISEITVQPEVCELTSFSEEVSCFIKAADTFFVASFCQGDDSSAGADVSHRGGPAGFVRVDNDGCLTIPDYAGNFHFNTLGNFLLNSSAGLLFIDFENGHILTMTGSAELILDGPEIKEFEGAERLWKFRLKKGYFIKNGTAVRGVATQADKGQVSVDG
jgi:predicted pyridoxine 5'-phosphate oxidase superfamily flavin-nucleotide-binding protein